MEVFRWIAHNWFEAIQTLGIVAGLVFPTLTLRADIKSRRIDNLFALTEHHQEIWNLFHQSPHLARILKPRVNLRHAPVTTQEKLFVKALILHLSGTHQAMRAGLFSEPDALHRDIRSFFALPIPREVWERAKIYQNREFVVFVEEARASE